MKHLIDLLHEMSLVEWGGALTGFVCVYLTVKNRIENWPWGIVSLLFYTWFFWKSEYYANAALQIFVFLPCFLYGWWFWAKCGPMHNDDLPVSALTPRAYVGWLLAAIFFSLCIGWPIARYTEDPFPYADSFTTGFSIVAQFLQAKKVFENWWIWIGVDIVYALYLFPVQKHWVSAILYALFTFLAVQGAKEWKPLIGKPKVVGP